MRKIFVSHACGENGDCQLAKDIRHRFLRDLKPVECFLSCLNRDCTKPEDIFLHIDQSHFFIPIISVEFEKRSNCKAELQRSRTNRRSSNAFPIILAVKYKSDSAEKRLGFNFDLTTNQGEAWADFDGKPFEAAYSDLLNLVWKEVLEHKLGTDENFNKDCKLLELILSETSPTALYLKTVRDACRAGEEYIQFIFKKLDAKHSDWLPLLDAEGLFDSNPKQYEPDAERQKGYFHIPLWPVLGFLERVSKDGKRETAERLMKIIKTHTVPNPPDKKPDNFKTWHTFVKIMANLPTDIIEIEDINLVRYWLESQFETTLVGSAIGESLFPKLLESNQSEDWKKAAKLVEIITEIKWVPSRAQKYLETEPDAEPDKEAQLKIPSHWTRELFKKNAQLLGEKCGSETVLCLKNRLVELLKQGESDDRYSYVWRAAIEDHDQNVGEDRPGHVLLEALRDVLLAYASSLDAMILLQDFLKSDLDTIKRVAMYVINQLFDRYQKIFWENLKPDLFISFNLRHELHLLLQQRFADFSNEEKTRVVDLISQLEGDWKKEADEDYMNTLLRAEWMKAVIKKGDDKADSFYRKYLETIKKEPEHPEFLGYMGPVSWGEESLVSPAELLAKGSVKAIVEYLNSFQGKNFIGEPAYDGLGETLKAAIKTEPSFFENNLSEFLKCHFPYQYYLIEAFRDLWKDRKTFDWKKVLKFCQEIVQIPDLWKKDEAEKDRYHRKDWIPTAIAQLIEEGVREDEKAFDSQYLPEAGGILKTVLQRQEPWKLEKKREDLLSWAINTPRGRTLEAFLSYALRCVRIVEKDSEEKEKTWQNLEPIFNRELELMNQGNYEFSAIAGRYLPNLYYMSKKWTEKNMPILFPNKNPKFAMNWRAAFDGYSYVNTIYSVIYDLLKKNGDLEKVLAEVFDDKRVRERVIDNIAVSYLRGQESLKSEDGLFARILQDWRHEDISDVIGLFWIYREAEFKNEEDERILNFWAYCHDKIKGNEKENQEVLSDINLLAVFLKRIDPKSKDWLLQSVPYVERRFHSTFLLEYLDRLADVSPKEVGEIFTAILKNTIPTFKEENVRAIVSKLYDSKHQDIANKICDIYRRADHEFLIDIYEKRNKESGGG